MDPLRAFQDAWHPMRRLTLDLLASLTPAELLFSPGPGLGPFWKQFRHMGAVQECYLEALATGRVHFTHAGRRYQGGADGEALGAYLRGLDQEMFAALAEVEWGRTIDWGPGDAPDVATHMHRLVEHEILHHGQWVAYVRLLGRPFPRSWGLWGLA